MRKLLIFTDLDGTLLDAATYSWEPARPALEALCEAGGLLIPCTSKTWSEVRPLQAQLGVPGPAIVENGAAIFGSDDEIRPPGASASTGAGWQVTLGPDHARIMEVLYELERRSGAELRAFSQLPEEEARALTGLSAPELRAARDRRHSEPFLASGADLATLQSIAEELGFQVTAGGRFFHLGGSSNKGAAVRHLTAAYAGGGWDCFTVGLGDSLNDRPLLAAVDWPFLIPKPDGSHDAALFGVSDRLHLVDEPGPRGWCGAVLSSLERWQGERDAP